MLLNRSFLQYFMWAYNTSGNVRSTGEQIEVGRPQRLAVVHAVRVGGEPSTGTRASNLPREFVLQFGDYRRERSSLKLSTTTISSTSSTISECNVRGTPPRFARGSSPRSSCVVGRRRLGRRGANNTMAEGRTTERRTSAASSARLWFATIRLPWHRRS